MTSQLRKYFRSCMASVLSICVEKYVLLWFGKNCRASQIYSIYSIFPPRKETREAFEIQVWFSEIVSVKIFILFSLSFDLFIRYSLHPSSKPDWCWDSSQWFVCSYEASGFSTRHFWSQGYLTRKASDLLDWFLLNFIFLKLTFKSLDSQIFSWVKSVSEVSQSSHIERWRQCFNLAHFLLTGPFNQ